LAGTGRTVLYANNLPDNQWIHVAAVWDRSGIKGTLETMRLYIDGNKVASGTYNDWGTSVGNWIDICGGNDNNIADKFAMDNLKIWNYAKTDFSDRFEEGDITPPAATHGSISGIRSMTLTAMGKKTQMNQDLPTGISNWKIVMDLHLPQLQTQVGFTFSPNWHQATILWQRLLYQAGYRHFQQHQEFIM